MQVNFASTCLKCQCIVKNVSSIISHHIKSIRISLSKQSKVSESASLSRVKLLFKFFVKSSSFSLCSKTIMESPNNPLQPSTYGNLITILSIDGGGIRGIIPATILSFLEAELQVFSFILRV